MVFSLMCVMVQSPDGMEAPPSHRRIPHEQILNPILVQENQLWGALFQLGLRTGTKNDGTKTDPSPNSALRNIFQLLDSFMILTP